jgi:hypothetical protein
MSRHAPGTQHGDRPSVNVKLFVVVEDFPWQESVVVNFQTQSSLPVYFSPNLSVKVSDSE